MKPTLLSTAIFFIITVGGHMGYASIPATLFFSEPQVRTASLSPDGKNIAIIKFQSEALRVVVVEASSKKERELFNASEYSDKETSVQKLLWVDSRFLAVQLVEFRQGIEDMLNTRLSRRLIIIDTDMTTPDEERVKSVRTSGWIASSTPNEHGSFLFAKTGSQSKIYTLEIEKLALDKMVLGKLDKIDGGQFVPSNEKVSIEGYALRWFMNSKGEVQAVLYFSSDHKLQLSEFGEPGKREVIRSWDFKEGSKDWKYLPIAKSAKPYSYFSLDLDEEEERSVYEVDFKTGAADLLYETQAYKIVDLDITDDYQLRSVWIIKDGAINVDYLIEKENAQSNTQNKYTFTSVNSSKDGKTSLIYTQSHNQPGQYWVRKGNSKSLVGEAWPKLRNRLSSSLIEGTVRSHDLNIPWLLTIPDKKPTNSVPLIVLPHGGPSGVYDNHYYDPITQFLASSGYAVLRVNFRGSSGHSKELRDGGEREWGDKMLSDILAATEVVLQRKDIDANRVCAVGASYGGYAATMLTILYPDIFNCAVTVSGVTDVNLYVHSPYATAAQKKWMKKYIGDPSTEFARLKEISPVYRVSELKRPLFVAHGVKDNTVDVENAERLIKMLKKHSKEWVQHIDEDSDHSFSGKGKSAELFEKIRTFLATNIEPQYK